MFSSLNPDTKLQSFSSFLKLGDGIQLKRETVCKNMAYLQGFTPTLKLGFVFSSLVSPKQRHPLVFPSSKCGFSLKFNDGSFKFQNPLIKGTKSVELDRFVTSDDEEEEEEMGDGFLEAIEELERMTREPSDVLEEMNDRLSARELQLVLVYFSQDGRDSWCALEVFDWLRKENRVDKETMELMVAIMCGWVKKLIQEQHGVGDVVDLLVDMDCVGLRPGFSMIEKVISLYWDMGEKEGAALFVEEVLRRGVSWNEGDPQGHKGGPTGYLAWKMMVRIL